jgi:glycerophosphoryl diester phosphodiesterase
MPGKSQLIAHRGASFDAPENTLAAEQLAWEQGADGFETDVHLTRDGRLIACHDDNVKRVTGRDAVIREHTLDELRDLDAGTWKGIRYAGEKLPTLEEQLALLPPGKHIFIELKGGPELVPALGRSLAGAAVDASLITIISFNEAALAEARRSLPQFRTSFLAAHDRLSALSPASRVEALVTRAVAAGCAGLGLQETWPLDHAGAELVRRAGLQLHVWTVDHVTVARRWIDLGAVTLTTNRPGWLREQLGA